MTNLEYQSATLWGMESDYCRVTETEQGLGLIEVKISEARWTKTFINFAAATNAAMKLKLIPPGMAMIATHRMEGYARQIRNHIPEGFDVGDLTAAGFRSA